MKVILLELPPLVSVVKILHRHLFPDTPASRDVQRVLLEELSLLLGLYLGLVEDYESEGMDYQYFDECDYFEECEPFFMDLLKHHNWQVHDHLQPSFNRIEALSTNGLLAIHLTPPKRTPSAWPPLHSFPSIAPSRSTSTRHRS